MVTMAAAVSLQFPATPALPSIKWQLPRCVRNGQNEEALDIFSRMHSTGVKPDEFTFGSVLKACSKLEIVERVFTMQINCLKNCLDGIWCCGRR
ncbi:hypothetical protein SUGI_0498800 [Cryptomeria japonica]|nr:hypothetical protein SUGI_0498800 [Cryptomeria japonica]